MVKILGILDIIVTVMLLAVVFNLDVPLGMIIFMSVCLFCKAFRFLFDIGSLFDIGAGALLILSIFTTPPSVILLIFAALLGLKGIMSLFARDS